MNKGNTMIMFGGFSSTILLISLISLHQTAHAVHVINRITDGFGKQAALNIYDSRGRGAMK